jgi:hypothetical protein
MLCHLPISISILHLRDSVVRDPKMDEMKMKMMEMMGLRLKPSDQKWKRNALFLSARICNVFARLIIPRRMISRFALNSILNSTNSKFITLSYSQFTVFRVRSFSHDSLGSSIHASVTIFRCLFFYPIPIVVVFSAELVIFGLAIFFPGIEDISRCRSSSFSVIGTASSA